MEKTDTNNMTNGKNGTTEKHQTTQTNTKITKESEEETKKPAAVHTITSIERDATKYIITVTDGTNTWKLRWPRKKLEQFRDKVETAPKIVPRFTRAKNFTVTDWVFSEKASQDYDRLMELFYTGPGDF